MSLAPGRQWKPSLEKFEQQKEIVWIQMADEKETVELTDAGCGGSSRLLVEP